MDAGFQTTNHTQVCVLHLPAGGAVSNWPCKLEDFGPFPFLGSDLLHLHGPVAVKLLVRALTSPAAGQRRQQTPRTVANCRGEQ